MMIFFEQKISYLGDGIESSNTVQSLLEKLLTANSFGQLNIEKGMLNSKIYFIFIAKALK